MKLESTLKFRPDLLYLAPLVNTVFLLLLYFLVNSSMLVRSGIRVDLPVSESSLGAMENAHVITITSGAPQVFFNEQRVATGDLPALLIEARKISRDVIINGDNNAPQAMIQRVINAVNEAGCIPYLGTRPATD